MFREHIKKAYQLIENGNYVEALGIFREILTEDSKNVEALIGSGYVLYCLQEYAEAMKTLEAVLLISPDDAKTHSLLGSIYYRLKDWYKATEHHNRAVTLEPSTAEYHLRLYIDLHMLKEPESALSHLETAFQLDPEILGPRGKWKLWRARITAGLGPLAWLASWVFLGLLLTLGGQYSLNRLLDWFGNYLPLASTQSGQTLLRAVLMSVPFVVVLIYQLCKRRYRRAAWALILWAIWGVLVWYIPHRAGVW